MTVFDKELDTNENFYYQVGDVFTLTPWTRPSYNKLKKYLLEIKETTDIMKDYTLILIGGVLFDFNTTWDVDICLLGDINILEKYLHQMYNIALNKHNLLVDIQWTSQKPYNYTYNELELKDFMNDDIDFIKLKYIKKSIGLETDERIYDGTEIGNYLIKSNYKTYGKNKDSFIDKIKYNSISPSILSFDVDEFLNTDENYFLTHTNRII